MFTMKEKKLAGKSCRYIQPTVMLIVTCIMFCLPSLRASAASEASWLKGVPLKQAIRIGNGTQVVIEISDPDCPFSRRMVSYWNMRKDVSRYVFLIALKNHPDAAQKARYILCAADRAAAHHEVYSGELDFGENEFDRDCNDRGLVELHRKVAATLDVSSTPTYYIKGIKINGAKVGEIEQILGGETYPFDATDSE